jgi:hypothetical protein
MKKLYAFVLPLLIAALSSCAGYHAGVSKPHQMKDVVKLAIPTFKNDTLEPRLEVLVTNAIIKKIQANGSYKIVKREEADAVLEGTIEDVDRQQFRAVRNNTLRTAELLVRLRLKYKIKSSSGVALLAGQKVGQSNIVLDPNFQLTERQATADAAERLAIDLASEISEGW